MQTSSQLVHERSKRKTYYCIKNLAEWGRHQPFPRMDRVFWQGAASCDVALKEKDDAPGDTDVQRQLLSQATQGIRKKFH